MLRIGLILVSVAATIVGCAPVRSPVVRALAHPPGEAATPGTPARTILALSGGGSYGAYSAGVLTGWSRANTRPRFDVVTGVSTGALIAPLAFLGPDYDPLMRRFYTEVGPDDIFTPQFWALPFSASAATNAPLRRILNYGITADVVAALAAEHAKGRRLYVATTQLDTRRTVVWDLGAVAGSAGGRALVIDILLASCAVPGVFPPVALPGPDGVALHVDGGVTTSVFVPPGVMSRATENADLYVLVAGKFHPDTATVPPRVLKVLGASGTALMHANLRREVTSLAHVAQLAGASIHVTSLRADYPTHDTGIEFDTASMGRMYVEGVQVGLAGPRWDHNINLLAPGADSAAIRTGP